MELSIQESRNLHWPWPLQNKPDAILPDLRMPKYSGFELCQTLKSLSSTQLIHVLVISGEAGANTTQFCRDLGAVAHFEEPVDFYALRVQLADLLKTRRKKRRSEVRVRRRFTLRLTGTDGDGQPLGDPYDHRGRQSERVLVCVCSRNLPGFYRERLSSGCPGQACWERTNDSLGMERYSVTTTCLPVA
jgi:CheY-like chemotaxis protein